MCKNGPFCAKNLRVKAKNLQAAGGKIYGRRAFSPVESTGEAKSSVATLHQLFVVFKKVS
jgi:hypothetical protein